MDMIKELQSIYPNIKNPARDTVIYFLSLENDLFKTKIENYKIKNKMNEIALNSKRHSNGDFSVVVEMLHLDKKANEFADEFDRKYAHIQFIEKRLSPYFSMNNKQDTFYLGK